MIQSDLFKLKLSERDILRAVRNYLRLYGWFVIRFHQGLGVHRGLSDLCAIKDGQVLWIETKTSKGKLSPWQEQFKQDIQDHGGVYLLIRDLDELIDILSKQFPTNK